MYACIVLVYITGCRLLRFPFQISWSCDINLDVTEMHTDGAFKVNLLVSRNCVIQIGLLNDKNSRLEIRLSSASPLITVVLQSLFLSCIYFMVGHIVCV